MFDLFMHQLVMVCRVSDVVSLSSEWVSDVRVHIQSTVGVNETCAVRRLH